MKIKLVILSVLVLFTSCGPIYFYQSTRERVQSTNNKNIESVQFFNDTEFTIVYKSASQDESISDGKVEFKDGYYYYYITFPKKTPAVAKHLDENRLRVYFEQGKYLTFGKYDNGKYGLYGETREDDSGTKRFYVNYEGKDFQPIGSPYLIIKKNIDVDVKEDKRKAKGVKVN